METQSPVPGPQSGGTNPDSIPSPLHRWLGAVPLFMIFIVLTWSVSLARRCGALYSRWKVDFPLPTKIALGLTEQMAFYYGLVLPVMFVLCWVYFGWGAKKGSRLVWFNLFFTIILLMVVFVFVGGIILPYFKIHSAMRR